jgi:hypothetical protein
MRACAHVMCVQQRTDDEPARQVAGDRYAHMVLTYHGQTGKAGH